MARPTDEEQLKKFMRALANHGGGARNAVLREYLGWSDQQYWRIQGRRSTGGTWTRPDIIALSMRTFRHWPGRYFDLWTFEIKPTWSVNVTGIYEAAAHSRCATQSFCAYHVEDIDGIPEDEVGRLVGEAQRLGVGLIFFTDPADYSTWDLRVMPVRREPDPSLLEEFIATQVSDYGQDQLLRWSK